MARPVPFVPLALRSALLTAFHDCMGHPSANRTTQLLRERYYWPNLSRDAAEHVRECHECTLSKRSRRLRHPVGTSRGQYPCDILYADILSMAPAHVYDKDAKSGAATSACGSEDAAGHAVSGHPLARLAEPLRERHRRRRAAT